MEIKDIAIGVAVTLIIVGAVIYLPGYIKGNQITIVAYTQYANLSSVNKSANTIVLTQYQLQVPYQILTASGVIYSQNQTSFAGAVPIKYPNENFIIKVGLGDSFWKANTITVNKTSVNGNVAFRIFLIPTQCTYTINTTNFCENTYFLK